ncbi:hypothetical protein CORC01_13042 [Colletotrichum orchidophilum]|uniref:DUF4149 domain-containing protein n=1 Tax=Colletotrichum orchidophilum TaxID=1209926 RepID=A0A1G4ARK8_9PEZI|nr:uncharacterized protein CORC01_13042 [Colletotrichum orchidophilum]OHE91652.1 hypothetical protein CORC01_13042 [Colletotrichum orchidophilum]
MASAIPTVMTTLAPYHIISYATLLGTSLFQTFTFPPSGPASLFKAKSDWIPVMVAGITSLANLLIYGPKTRQAMIDRTHQETRDAKRPGDVDEPSPDMVAVRRRFSINHAMSIHLNLIAIAAMLWYGFRLASRIHIEVDS